MAQRRGSPGIGLRGRRELTAFVRQCLEAGNAERPVITLLGPHGSGASEAHGTLMAEFGENDAPFAYLNFAAERAEPRYALGLIARQMERKLEKYRISRFPRLMLGQVAADSDVGQLDAVERPQQLRSLRRQLTEYESRTFGPLSEMVATGAVSVLGLPENTPDLFGPLMQGALNRGTRAFSGTRAGRRLHHSAHWYSEHRLTGGATRWDAVLDLNHWRNSGSAEDAEKLEQILMEAFLEDLRANSDRNWAPGSYLLLLDNCHKPQGRRFLDLLVSARANNHALGLPCAPLTTVISTNLWLPRWGPSSGKQWQWKPREPDGASLKDWKKRRPYSGSTDSWWYPLRLRDLSLDEVRTRLSSGQPRDPELAPFVHRLTAGLPRAVHEVVTLIDRTDFPSESGRERDAWLRNLPDRALPGGYRTPVPLDRPQPEDEDDDSPRLGVRLVDASLDLLLNEFGDEERDTLTRCSAAVDLSVGSQVLGGNFSAQPSTSLFLAARSRFLLFHPGAVSEPPTLHPWLRRLLLWKLAERPDEWDEAHALLAGHFASVGQKTQEMYHRLAGHDVDAVTDHLLRRYEEAGTLEWIDEFNVITAAPNRHPRTQDHADLTSSLTPVETHTDNPVERAVRALVVARWLWSDPLTDPEMRLGPALAQRFARLSEYPRSDNLHLFNEAERYSNWIHPQIRSVEG